MQHHTETGPTDRFPTDATGLPVARAPELVELSDGEHFDLRIAPVAKRLGDATVRMLAYNGSIPGPTLKVRQGSEVVVDVDNQGDMDATVHWHGLRLENRYDGTHETQAPIPVGESFSARVTFPDPGLYWYHPHIREDYGQEMGLYGNVLVEPADPDYWPPAHRELVLTLDDILIEDGKVAPFSRSETTYAAMGRFGNVLLVGGEPDLALTARLGEVVRLYLTNTANTRVFKVKLPGARMKLVGGDSGRVEHEQFVEDVVLAPSERVVVDVLFDRAGRARAGAPHAGADLSAGRDHRRRGAGEPVAAQSGSRPCAPIPSWRPSASGVARVSGGRAGQDAGVRRRDGHGRARGGRAGRLRLPDAPGGRHRRARPLPEVRHEAARGRGAGDDLHLPDAPGGRQRAARPLPGVRHEAAAGAARRRGRDGHEHDEHDGDHARPRPRGGRAASSGKTTWSRSTG